MILAIAGACVGGVAAAEAESSAWPSSDRPGSVGSDDDHVRPKWHATQLYAQ